MGTLPSSAGAPSRLRAGLLAGGGGCLCFIDRSLFRGDLGVLDLTFFLYECLVGAGRGVTEAGCSMGSSEPTSLSGAGRGALGLLKVDGLVSDGV